VNYVQRIRTELAKRLPDCDDALIDLYTLLALQYGAFVQLVDVHNAWAVWRNRTDPEHRSLIPFPYLAPDVQEMDRPYMEAISATARAVYDALIGEAIQAGECGQVPCEHAPDGGNHPEVGRG
jgi:hypothetical protein